MTPPEAAGDTGGARAAGRDNAGFLHCPADPVILLAGLARPVAAVLIDLDGTLVDTVGDFELALAGMLGELPGQPTREVDATFVTRTVGQGSEHLVRCTLAHVGLPAELFDTACALYQQHYRRINGSRVRVYPGVREGLQALRDAGLPLACLTNKPGAFARELLDQLGLLPFFVQVVGGDAFERKKPDPLPLLKLCEALNASPSDVLMLGDSRNDAQAARAAGCPVVLVRYGYNHGEPVEAVGADALIDRLDDLRPLR